MHALPRLSAATICQVCFGLCEHGGATVTPFTFASKALVCSIVFALCFGGHGWWELLRAGLPESFAMRLSEHENSVPEGKQILLLRST